MVAYNGKILVENNENPSVVEYWLTAVWCWGSGKKVSLGFRSPKKLGEGNCTREQWSSRTRAVE